MGRITIALIVAGLASPAWAQVQQGNPNAANQSLSGMSQNRAAQQSQTGQSDTTMMNAERGRTAAPPPPGGGATPRIGR
jgi:hypothetical protein